MQLTNRVVRSKHGSEDFKYLFRIFSFWTIFVSASGELLNSNDGPDSLIDIIYFLETFSGDLHQKGRHTHEQNTAYSSGAKEIDNLVFYKLHKTQTAIIIKVFPSRILSPSRTNISIWISQSEPSIFDVSARDYACQFYKVKVSNISEKRNFERWQTVPAAPSSSTQITCSLPILTPEQYVPAIQVEISKSGSAIATWDESHVHLEYVPFWVSLKPTAVASAFDSQPKLIEIHGWNLDSLAIYKIRFIATDETQHRMEVTGHRRFRLFEWPYEDAICRVEIFLLHSFTSFYF